MIEDRVVVKDGEVKIRSMMTISLNFNQKILDPVVAALFLQDICKLMEGGMASWLKEEEEHDDATGDEGVDGQSITEPQTASLPSQLLLPARKGFTIDGPSKNTAA
jgi:hypothetical protein